MRGLFFFFQRFRFESDIFSVSMNKPNNKNVNKEAMNRNTPKY